MLSRVVIAVLAAALLGPGTAVAATTVDEADGTVFVEGDASANAITISEQDEYVVIAEQGATVVDAAEADDCEQDGARVRCTTLEGFEGVRVRGGEGDDTLSNDTNLGDVLLQGMGGHDTLNSGAVDAYTDIRGGEGNDTLNARAGGLSFEDSGDAGDDTFNGGVQTDYFHQEPGADVYAGGALVQPDPLCGIDPESCPDHDSVVYDSGPVAVTLDGVANDGRAGEGDDVHADVEAVRGTDEADVLSASGLGGRRGLSGGAGDDTITGGEGDDDLEGGTGADTIVGGGGDDRLRGNGFDEDAASLDRLDGGAGDDEFVTGPGREDLSGGPGIDAASFEGAERTSPTRSVEITLDDQPNDGLRGAPEGDNVRADIEVITTGAGADRLIGAAGTQQLASGIGDDEVDGGAGFDVVDAGNGSDAIVSRDGGFDVVNCGDGADAPVQADEGDRLEGCEAAALTPLPRPSDATAPQVVLGGSRKLSARAFGRARGVSVTVRTGEPASLLGEAIGRGMVARAGDLVLGQRALPPAGTTSRRLRIVLPRTYLRAVQRRLRRGAYRITVRVAAVDAAGNRTTASRRITVARAPRRR